MNACLRSDGYLTDLTPKPFKIRTGTPCRDNALLDYHWNPPFKLQWRPCFIHREVNLHPVSALLPTLACTEGIELATLPCSQDLGLTLKGVYVSLVSGNWTHNSMCVDALLWALTKEKWTSGFPPLHYVGIWTPNLFLPSSSISALRPEKREWNQQPRLGFRIRNTFKYRVSSFSNWAKRESTPNLGRVRTLQTVMPCSSAWDSGNWTVDHEEYLCLANVIDLLNIKTCYSLHCNALLKSLSVLMKDDSTTTTPTMHCQLLRGYAS